MDITLLNYPEGMPPQFNNADYGKNRTEDCLNRFALQGTFQTFESALHGLYASRLGTDFQLARCNTTGLYLVFDTRGTA